jgi:hypothetical protein
MPDATNIGRCFRCDARGECIDVLCSLAADMLCHFKEFDNENT